MSSEEEDNCPSCGNSVDISLKQDGGVLKEIIKFGDPTRTPGKGDRVFVHYTGKFTNGTVFDSSRDRDDPFVFFLGKGEVIKALDIGIATMMKGEQCILTCAPEYAYGMIGNPPIIPGGATLVFDVELRSWYLEDISPDADNAICRSLVTEGTGSDTPKMGAFVDVHLIGRLNNSVFDERDVIFQLGDGSEQNIVEGIEIALKHFKKGETSKILLTSRYAFGCKGNAELNIKPGRDVEYEVTLNNFEKTKEIWHMNMEERLEQSKIMKVKGTKSFKEAKYETALKQYEKIVEYLQYDGSLEVEQKQQRDSTLLAGYLNLAACYLKLNNPEKVIENSDKALKLDPDNSKGHFRRGQAHFAMKNYAVAKIDFEKVFYVDPTNKAAQNQVALCIAHTKRQMEQEKTLYKNMFEKMYISEK